MNNRRGFFRGVIGFIGGAIFAPVINILPTPRKVYTLQELLAPEVVLPIIERLRKEGRFLKFEKNLGQFLHGGKLNESL